MFDDVINVWQSQTTEGFRMSHDDIKRRSEQLDAKLRRATYDIYAAFVLSSAVAVLMAALSPTPLQTIAVGVMIPTFGVLAVQIREMRLQAMAPFLSPAENSIAFHRAQLAQQLRFTERGRFWSRMLALAVGPPFFMFAFTSAHPELRTIMSFPIVTYFIALVVMFPIRKRMAARLRAELAQLDRLAL